MSFTKPSKTDLIEFLKDQPRYFHTKDVSDAYIETFPEITTFLKVDVSSPTKRNTAKATIRRYIGFTIADVLKIRAHSSRSSVWDNVYSERGD
jgi:hypothetical protein